MNSKNILLSFLLFLIVMLSAAGAVFADFTSETVFRKKAFVVFAAVLNVNHNHILRISPYQYPNEYSFVSVGNYTGNAVTNAYLEYYINDDSSTVNTIDFAEISSPFQTKPFNIPSSASNFAYRFVFVENLDTKKYYPKDDWIFVPVADSSSTTIGQSGGELILDNADQRYGNSKINFSANVLSVDSAVKLTESDISIFSQEGLLRLYHFDCDHDLSSDADFVLYYGSSNNGQLLVKYSPDGSTWENLDSVVFDSTGKTVSFNSAKTGYYGIFKKIEKKDGDYRPQYRVFTLGNKIKFRNLSSGDSVTIYDINGRQVRKLTQEPFEWDGIKDSGAYAESGSYLYQIKVNGKIISGSIAFVR